jgi:hypothetical protein
MEPQAFLPEQSWPAPNGRFPLHGDFLPKADSRSTGLTPHHQVFRFKRVRFPTCIELNDEPPCSLIERTHPARRAVRLGLGYSSPWLAASR